ncbi:hypothetical protein LCGC14_1814600 [marine sediment metagenome]|uniref:Uncharacterized protein n=1 Tax=marine sediment metagenome TaxID=412755 RepID=A0A0F9GKW7_9ZZZZ
MEYVLWLIVAIIALAFVAVWLGLVWLGIVMIKSGVKEMKKAVGK